MWNLLAHKLINASRERERERERQRQMEWKWHAKRDRQVKLMANNTQTNRNKYSPRVLNACVTFSAEILNVYANQNDMIMCNFATFSDFIVANFYIVNSISLNYMECEYGISNGIIRCDQNDINACNHTLRIFASRNLPQLICVSFRFVSSIPITVRKSDRM